MHSMLCMLTLSTQMTYTFVFITSLIFINFQSGKVLESWDSGLPNRTIKYYICWHCQCKLEGFLIHSMLCMSKQLKHFVHRIHTCNGMHVDADDTIKLQCRFLYKVFELHENSITRLDLLWIRTNFELKLWITVTFNETTVKFLLNWWNFELTMFELTVHFKHEIWQRFHRNFELSGTSN